MSFYCSKVYTNEKPVPHATHIPVGATVARMSDNDVANIAAIVASASAGEVVGGVTTIAVASGTVGSGVELGAAIGCVGGPVGAVVGGIFGGVIGGLCAFAVGDTAKKATQAVQKVFNVDLESVLAGIHWGIHVGNGRIIEFLDDSNVHQAWITSGNWDRPVAVIRTGSHYAAADAEQRFARNSEGKYDLWNNNCRDFCRRCW